MYKDVIKGKWEQVKGMIKEKWGEITDDEMAQIDGDYMKLIGWIQEEKGLSEIEAKKEADLIAESLDPNSFSEGELYKDRATNDQVNHTMR